MKRKLTYLLGLLLTTSALWAECEITYTGYHGPLNNPYETKTNDYIIVDPTTTHSQVLPATPDSALTVYGVDAGRVAKDDPSSATYAIFSFIPTRENPNLAIWYAVECATGTGGHEPAYGGISIITPDGQYSECNYSFIANHSTITSQGFISSGQVWSPIINVETFYRNWQLIACDLSAYIGKVVQIKVLTTTCTTDNCSSEIYVAFDCFNRNGDDKQRVICASCDNVTLNAPSGYTNYEWHKGSPTGQLVGSNEPLVIQGKWNVTNYYCTIIGDCGEAHILYPVVDVHPLFDYDVHCGETSDTVYLTNKSYFQERVVPYTKTPCPAAEWNFGDGRTSTDPNLPYIVYSRGGNYTISLKAGTDDFSCSATTSKTITVCPPEDSIPLNPLPLIPVTDSIDSVVCHGTVVEWRNMYLTETGIYRDTLLSKTWGTDSIYYVLNLTVLGEPVEIPLKDTTSCNLVPFLWRGHQIVSDTTCYDTIRTTKLGCDSIYASLHFVVKEPSSSDTTAYTCYGTPFIWHGKPAVDGDTIVLTNAVGCDSIVTLKLIILSADTTTNTASICEGSSYTWKRDRLPDRVLSTPGNYADTVRYIETGCDSMIYRLSLSIDNINKDSIARFTCEGTPYIWRSKSLETAGVYRDTAYAKTATECDTVYILKLSVNPTYNVDTFATACGSFTWYGQEYATSGDYPKTFATKAGCDSIVTLHLFVSAAPITQTFDTIVCDTLLPLKWRGRVYDKPMTYRDTFYTTLGCDSIYRSFTLDTVHCVRPEPPVPPEPPVDTCVSNLVYRKWVDFIFCDNGRDEFVAFQWYRNNLSIAGETGQYLYLPGTMGAAEYFVEATKTDGSKIRTCPLIFDNTPRSRDTYVNVQTVIRRGQPLQIAMSDPEADIAIYTLVGQPVLSAHILGPETSLPIPLPAGTYVLRLIGANINTTTKILIE